MTADVEYLNPGDSGSEKAPAGPALPHNLEIEQALLGAIFVNNDALTPVRGFLDAEHFFEPLHSRIYEVCQALIDEDRTATPVTVKNYLQEDEALQAVGGTQYLGRLTVAAVTVLHAEDYGKAIVELAMRRQLIHQLQSSLDEAYKPKVGVSVDDVLDGLQESLAEIETPHTRQQASFPQVLVEAFEEIEEAQRGDVKMVPTGLSALNTPLSGGLYPTDLIIAAGRPGMGKTALAVLAILTCARTVGPVDFYSLEMSRSQLAQRMFAMRAEVNSQKMRRKGGLTQEDMQRIAEESKALSGLDITVDDTPDRSIESIRASARTRRKRFGTEIVVIDHLGLIKPPRGKNNRTEEISHITGQAKQMAKELGVPVLLLSQLNRDVEKRENKRPGMADLRDGGTIEQDADQILFLYRDEYYLEKEGTNAKDYYERMADAKGKAEIIIGKNRHGDPETVHVKFDAHFTRFADLEADKVDEGFF